MKRLYILEKMKLNGKPMQTPLYYFNLSTYEGAIPPFTWNEVVAICQDGSEQQFAMAKADAVAISDGSRERIRIREVTVELLSPRARPDVYKKRGAGGRPKGKSKPISEEDS